MGQHSARVCAHHTHICRILYNQCINGALVWMDNTALFRACAKAMRVRKKQPTNAQQRELSHDSCPLTLRARELTATITQLRDFLVANRKDYIHSGWRRYCAGI